MSTCRDNPFFHGMWSGYKYLQSPSVISGGEREELKKIANYGKTTKCHKMMS